MSTIFLAKKIRAARENANLSQKVLSERLNISNKTVSAYESGRIAPSLDVLMDIAKITNVDLNFFQTPDYVVNDQNTNDPNLKLDIILSILREIKQKIEDRK